MANAPFSLVTIANVDGDASDVERIVIFLDEL